MRKISHHRTNHNVRRVVLPYVFLLLPACLAAGCQNTGDQTRQVPAGEECAVKIDVTAWEAFKNLTEPMSRGEQVAESDLEAYALMPPVVGWGQSLAPQVPNTRNIINWLQHPWNAALGREPSGKLNANRATIGRNYRYDHEHADEIDSLLAYYTAGDATCELTEIIAKWISPANRPDSLVINFLPAMAEIRLHEGEVYADVGVLAAGGLAQTNRSIATLLYRNYEFVPGANPLEAVGEQAVAECLRMMVNEGIASWVEQTSQIAFDPEHPALFKVRIIPVDFYRKARQTMERLADSLPGFFADPDLVAAQGQTFARGMAGGNSFLPTGLAAAELIVARLGEERLLAVHNSPSDFWAAYQEAALQNSTPLPLPGQRGIELYESLPPFPADLYEPMQDLLKRHF